MEKKRRKMEKKQEMESSNKNWEIPPDHILHQLIFSKLSIVDLQACRQVCKSWNNIVVQFDSNLFFAQTSPDSRNIHCMDFDPKHMGAMNSLASFTFHPKYSSASSKILCCCHGLLLCSFRFFKFYDLIEYSRTKICILNPFTNEYLVVSSDTGNRHDNYSYAFGFSLNTKQFKIVRFTYKHSSFQPSSTSIEIYAFETLCPRLRPLGFLPTSIQTDGAYYFNGALYWVGTDQQLLLKAHKDVIYCLDLEDYKLNQCSLPQHNQFRLAYFFGALNGALYLTTLENEDQYQMWKMEQDVFSCIILFVLPKLNLRFSKHLPQHSRSLINLQPIKICEDGKFLCLLGGLVFLLCDPNTGTTQVLTDQDVEIEKHFKVFPIETFNFNSLHNILLGCA
ncbi:F-box protein At3g07870-like [Benincasa hispida]|uniref:F-box protein At3g07870-like n=1 Tax=Benincasa hispida TaxID=102211 RepID=UPI0018FFFCFF|nr:F-box protein At3g07870-like [Benincasa hispida]XP_038878454.1 F-box protein At3g07870-like [Benincasa hispida]